MHFIYKELEILVSISKMPYNTVITKTTQNTKQGLQVNHWKESNRGPYSLTSNNMYSVLCH